MVIKADTVEDYINQVSDDKKEAIIKLRNIILRNIPKGFHECINYQMISYVVPHSIYPKGYHCDPKLPLPFVSVAAQKNFVAIYHMGIYADPQLMKWFTAEHQLRVKAKLDMGKSCIRYKKVEQIPYELIAELMSKTSVKQWIETYEHAFHK